MHCNSNNETKDGTIRFIASHGIPVFEGWHHKRNEKYLTHKDMGFYYLFAIV